METGLIACPRCGHSNQSGVEFCNYCGFNLTNYYANGEFQNDQLTVNDLYAFPDHGVSRLVQFGTRGASAASQAARPANLKRIHFEFHLFEHPKRWSFVAAALVIIVGGYGIGRFYYSKATTLDRITQGFDQGKVDRNVVTRSDANQSLTWIDDWFKTHPAMASRFKAELTSKGRTHDGFFTYQKTGRHFGVFPKYQLVVNQQQLAAKKQQIAERTYSVKIHTAPYAVILVNDKPLSYADGNGNYRLSGLASHSISLKAKYTDQGAGVITKPVTVTNTGKDQTVSLVEHQSYSNDSAQSLLTQTYQSMGTVTNQGSGADKMAQSFVDGANNRYYQSVHQLALAFHNYHFQTTYQPKVTAVQRVANHQYQVDYQLTYRFNVGGRVHVQVFATTAVVNHTTKTSQLVSVVSAATPLVDRYENAK